MQGTRRYRRNLPHIQEEGRTFFITFRVKRGIFLPSQARSIIMDCCERVHMKSAVLHCAVVMPDHVHLVLTPLQSEAGNPSTLSDILKRIKGISARQVNRFLGRKGSLWQDESFDHMMRHDESTRRKCDYVLENPVRKGLSKTIADYPWTWRTSQSC